MNEQRAVCDGGNKRALPVAGGAFHLLLTLSPPQHKTRFLSGSRANLEREEQRLTVYATRHSILLF